MNEIPHTSDVLGSGEANRKQAGIWRTAELWFDVNVLTLKKNTDV